MNFEKNFAFEASCQLRPIKAFSLESLLENNMDNRRRFLTADAKLLWFHTFCNEQGLRGHVKTTFLSSEKQENFACSTVEGGVFYPYKEYWEAIVYINGEAISSAVASSTYSVNKDNDREFASSQIRKGAIGAALSQAGFGVISSFDMSPTDIANLEKELGHPVTLPQNTAPAVTEIAPGQTSFFAKPAQVAPNPFAGQVAAEPIPNNAANYAAQPGFVQPAPPVAANQVDPVVAAKQVVYMNRGRYEGKTLGQILAEGGKKAIQYIADGNPRTTPPELLNAARTILQSLATGR